MYVDFAGDCSAILLQWAREEKSNIPCDCLCIPEGAYITPDVDGTMFPLHFSLSSLQT